MKPARVSDADIEKMFAGNGHEEETFFGPTACTPPSSLQPNKTMKMKSRKEKPMARLGRAVSSLLRKLGHSSAEDVRSAPAAIDVSPPSSAGSSCNIKGSVSSIDLTMHSPQFGALLDRTAGDTTSASSASSRQSSSSAPADYHCALAADDSDPWLDDETLSIFATVPSPRYSNPMIFN